MSDNIIEQLEKLGELKKNGLLTEEEFQQQKARILNNNPKQNGKQNSVLDDISDLSYYKNNALKTKSNNPFVNVAKIVGVGIIVIALFTFFKCSNSNTEASTDKSEEESSDVNIKNSSAPTVEQSNIYKHNLTISESMALSLWLGKSLGTFDSFSSALYVKELDFQSLFQEIIRNPAAAKSEYGGQVNYLLPKNYFHISNITTNDGYTIITMVPYSAPPHQVVMYFNSDMDVNGITREAIDKLRVNASNNSDFVCFFEDGDSYSGSLSSQAVANFNYCRSKYQQDYSLNKYREYYDLHEDAYNNITIEDIVNSNESDDDISYFVKSCVMDSDNTDLDKCRSILDAIIKEKNPPSK